MLNHGVLEIAQPTFASYALPYCSYETPKPYASEKKKNTP